MSKDVWGKGPEEGTEPVAAVSGGKGISLGRSGSVAEGPARGVVDGRHRVRRANESEVGGAHPCGGAFLGTAVPFGGCVVERKIFRVETEKTAFPDRDPTLLLG